MMANKAMWNGRLLGKGAVTAGVAGIVGVFALAAALVVSGRETQPAQAPIITANGADPAAANLAEPATTGAPATLYGAPSSRRPNAARVLSASAAYAPQNFGTSYPAGQQAPAPIVRGNNPQQNESLQYNTQPPATNGDANAQDSNGQYPSGQPPSTDPNAVDPNAPGFDNQAGDTQENAGYDALEQADQAPPPLPEYDQPPAPEDNYLWTPGYWGYNTGYYFVPGAWVAPPFYGALWTPPWWGWYGSRYYLHRGYWGNHIGYYGGVNYGYGYVGSGFYGGYWQGHNFYYNRAVTNVNVSRVRNVYERSVVINNTNYGGRPLNRTSFNGPGGIQARPRSFELTAMREPHYAPVPAQLQSRQLAASNRGQFFNQNRGRPAEAFHDRPLSSTSNIAATPQHAPINQNQVNQSNQRQLNDGRQGNGNLNSNQNNRSNQPVTGATEVNRSGVGIGGGAPRNDMIQQRTGLWNADRNGQGQPQRDQQVQQQQRQAVDLQRNQQLQQQQQQQRQAVDLQRNQQLQQQQQQQRQAVDQQRNQQLQQQQQRQAVDLQRNQQFQQMQQQRNQQFQQQRGAEQQQRSIPQAQPQPQHIEARPAPQGQPVAAPRPQPQSQPGAQPRGEGFHGGGRGRQ